MSWLEKCGVFITSVDRLRLTLLYSPLAYQKETVLIEIIFSCSQQINLKTVKVEAVNTLVKKFKVELLIGGLLFN